MKAIAITLLVIVVLAIVALFGISVLKDARANNAHIEGQAPAYVTNIHMSARMDTCTISDGQLIANEVTAHQDYYKQYTVDQVLNALTPGWPCIAPEAPAK